MRLADARTKGEELRAVGLRAAETARERVPGGPAIFESLERERAAGSNLLAGGLAYRLFLWLVPLGLVLAALGSFWAGSDRRGVVHTAREFGISGAAARSARAAFTEGAHSKWYLLALGIVFLEWFGIGAVRALRITHQIAWADRGGKLHNPLGASLLFTTAVVAVSLIGFGSQWVRHNSSGLFGVLVLVGMFAVYAGVAVWAMSLLPHGKAPALALLPGAVLAGIGMILVQAFVSVYLAPKLERQPQLYGALGAATVILLWLYIIARLVVSAAFLNATLWDRRNRPVEG
ncbi:MAG TPA: YhjD/YihY/BrkB family envelope integrity protein [Gaiellaceae bacterium]|nr:YhjD/YihY/BrkB family envelope integrity protein [Gaiellaceae bacterium]